MAAEKKKKEAAEHLGIGKALSDARVLACAFVYFCLNAASYGVAFFLPTIVKGFGVSNFETGLLAALPFVFGAIGMVLLGRNSDRTLKRREHVCFAMVLAAVGVAGAGLVSSPALVLGLLCLSQIGVSAMPPLFWPIPSAFLTGASAAAGIAAINSLGNLSGFGGPYIMGFLRDLTGNFTAGLLVLAAAPWRRDRRHDAEGQHAFGSSRTGGTDPGTLILLGRRKLTPRLRRVSSGQPELPWLAGLWHRKRMYAAKTTRAPALGFGFSFEDLTRRQGLVRLDRLFLDRLAAEDEALHVRLLAARAAPEELDAKQEGELLVALGPHLDGLVASCSASRPNL